MADYTAPLGLLAGLLSLPKAWEDQRQQTELNNALISRLGDANNPIPQAPVPGHFPGTQVPVLGSVLRGVGTAGQILGSALGNAPRTPQIEPALLGMLLTKGRFDENLDWHKQVTGMHEQDVAARLKQTEAQDAWRRQFAEEQAKERVAQHEEIAGIAQGNLDLRREIEERGKTPSDPAVAAYMRLHPQATPEEIQHFELQGKPGAAAAAQDPTMRGALTPFKLFKHDHPTARNEDWDDYQIAEGLKKATAIRGTKPLPAPVQQTVSSMESIRTAMARMKTMLLNDPDVAAGRGLGQGRFEQMMYTVGLAQPGQDPYIALQNLMRVVGAQPWMRNVRRYDMIQDIRQHLPKAGDTKDLIVSKIDNLDMFGIETEAQALKFAYATIGSVPGLEQGLQQQGQQYNLPQSTFTLPGTGAPTPQTAPAPTAGAQGQPDPWDAVRKALQMPGQ
jgi:hypothetical protein